MSDIQAIDACKAIADTSFQMLEAARRNDWERLVELDSRYTRLIGDFKGNPFDLPSTGVNRECMIAFLQSALDNNRAIEYLVGPHLLQLSRLIGSVRTERKLSDAYSLSLSSQK